MTFRKLALYVAVAASSFAVSAQSPQPVVKGSSVRDDVFQRGATPFAGGVTGYHGIEFSNVVGFRPVEMDLYLPAKHAEKLPLVVWVHGGGWSRGDARTSGAFADWPGVLASLAARGYVVASVDYRMSGEAKFPAAIQDVKASIRFLREHAEMYGIDPARVYVWGGSAGGHLAALEATTCGVAALEPKPSTGRLSRSQMAKATVNTNVSDCVQGAAIWYGLFDLRMDTTGDAAEWLGCEKDHCEEAMKQGSPMTYVGAKTPPMLLMHGTADKTVTPKQTELMTEALKKLHVPVETVYLPDVDHGFMGKTPESTRDASLRALDVTFAFFDKLSKQK